MCRLMCHCVRHISLDDKVWSIRQSDTLIPISLEGWYGALVRQEELGAERDPSDEELTEVAEVRHDAVSSPSSAFWLVWSSPVPSVVWPFCFSV